MREIFHALLERGKIFRFDGRGCCRIVLRQNRGRVREQRSCQQHGRERKVRALNDGRNRRHRGDLQRCAAFLAWRGKCRLREPDGRRGEARNVSEPSVARQPSERHAGAKNFDARGRGNRAMYACGERVLFRAKFIRLRVPREGARCCTTTRACNTNVHDSWLIRAWFTHGSRMHRHRPRRVTNAPRMYDEPSTRMRASQISIYSSLPLSPRFPRPKSRKRLRREGGENPPRSRRRDRTSTCSCINMHEIALCV